MTKIIIVSAPSGCGKSTLINHVLHTISNIKFSISATSRLPRGEEKNGVEYFFLKPEDFRKKIEKGDFLEFCEVYSDNFYGTLKNEVDKLLNSGINVICDVDVVGAQSIKKIYRDRALTIFIKPPSIEELRKRLICRGTESEEIIEKRIKRAEYELSEAVKFDKIIVNDKIETAKNEIIQLLKNFIND